MNKILNCFLLSLGMALIVSCEQGGGPSSSGLNITVIVKSATLSSRLSGFTPLTAGPMNDAFFKSIIPERKSHVSNTRGTTVTVSSSGCITMASLSYCPCTIQNMPDLNVSGYCADPVEVSGGLSSISLFKTARIPARIIGGGMELSTKQGWELDVESFDLRDASQMVGEDNLEDSVASTNWEGVQAYFSHIDVKLPPIVASSTTAYYTLRYVFYAQPLTGESVIQACGFDSGDLGRIEDNADFLSGLTFKRNDILICSKSTSTDCVNADFTFLDTSGSGTLVATRPGTESNVFKTGIVDDSELDCSKSSAEAPPDMNIGGMWLLGDLATEFNLTAEIDGGEKTYTHTSSTGTVTTGSKVVATVDYDISNKTFINTSGANLTTWLDSSSLSTILQNTHFLPVFVRNQLDTRFDGESYTVEDAALPAAVSVTLE